MAVLWVILILFSTGLEFSQGFPVDPTPRVYPHESSGLLLEGWSSTVLLALALILTAAVVLFGCTWCYRHKDCKLFTASVTHLHDGRRAQPLDSGFSEPVNNNISEDNNNGPISLREMQNIANNNAAVYITSENEERNRISRESVVEFEPLPADIRVVDPLERCADWFAGEDFQRDQLQYLREIGRGWFGRVVKGEVDDGCGISTVAVKILNQNVSLEDKARFLDEARLYRDMDHENVLSFVAKCLQEDPWILLFELCSMDLQQYLIVNRPKMAILNESGVPLQLMCDVSSALAYIHSRGYLYGNLWSGNILVRGNENVRAVLGCYSASEAPVQCAPPETNRQPPIYNTSSDVWSLGWLVWEVCAWGATPPPPPAPAPELPCPYRNHLYQVMQLCWSSNPEGRPSASQVHALINHLYYTHSHTNDSAKDQGYSSSDFEERWQKLKPNTIPKIDEHVAIIHAPSTSTVSHFTRSDQEYDNTQTLQDSLSVELDTAVSGTSSIMSDRDPLSVQLKSDSLTNLHGSLEDVRNIYLTHNETAALECHQGNMQLEDSREREQDRSDSSMDPWLKDIMNGSQDDVSYYKDVSDVIKNLDNILNSEKTSSSESSHQASPSRDNLSLECKKDYPMQTSMVKSPGISNFQNILDMGFDSKSESPVRCEEDEGDGDTIGTLSHSFERHSDTISQQTLENLTPDTPNVDLKSVSSLNDFKQSLGIMNRDNLKPRDEDSHLPNENNVVSNNSVVPKLMELCVSSMPSVSENKEKVILKQDCQTSNNNTSELVSVCKQNKSIDDNIAFIKNEIDLENGLRNKDEIIVNEKISNDTQPEVRKQQKSDSHEQYSITKQFNCNDNAVDEISSSATNDIKNADEEEEIPAVLLQNTEGPEIACNKMLDTAVLSNEGLNDAINEIIADNSETKNISSTCQGKQQISNESISPVMNCTYTNKYDESLDADLIGDIDKRPSNDSDNVAATQIVIQEPIISKTNSILLEQHLAKEIKNENTHEEVYTELQSDVNETSNMVLKLKESIQSDANHIHGDKISDELMPVSENRDDFSAEEKKISSASLQPLEPITRTEQPETVQNSDVNTCESNVIVNNDGVDSCRRILDDSISDKVQTSDKVIPGLIRAEAFATEENITREAEDAIESNISPNEQSSTEKFSDSTVYMDLINDTNSKILKDESLDSNIKNVIKSCLDVSDTDTQWSLVKNDSTVYLDLPSLVKETHDFLHSEKMLSSKTVELGNVYTSTPKGSNTSTDSTLEAEDQETEIMSVTKVPDYGPGVTLTKLEQKHVPENVSPFDSPSKSHHTDTYDENSSVVLGPFENFTLDLFKGVKSDLTDLHKEEILALSSNFSEMNLETPSPLRDSNFLNEVPDIVPDELHFDDIATLSEGKPESLSANKTEETEEQSSTEKHVSPLTPPNSPGNFLATTSHQKYLVDIDINNSNLPNASNEDVVDLNQIDLQITTKLAMAENENNMNLEYSGPLTEESLIFNESVIIADSEAVAESYLAGNKSSGENLRDSLAIDEERMKELRNELELKLPLAQVAGIEPAVESEWTELPPPPELVLTYGALSPIAEETRMQLSAYENDDQWNTSTRTESSASYPEPCNNSDELTDLPTAQHSTYTITKDINHTYTVQKEVPSSKEITMSADSLNASPLKKLDEIPSPIDDLTYTKNDDEKDANCERLSQVSPFLLSPTTDTSVPESDNVAGVSTVSKTTVPTDAKTSKPSETQCLSKAASIDSWCSNDTLYNVEENFDDLAMDSDVAVDIEAYIEKDMSESEDTLTHNDDDKELSHCSTYIIHDSKSEVCETFTPDSITANDNYTYTKVKSEAVGTTPSVITKSDLNDSTKNTQTKDLAYGTLMSGLPTYSHCTTELASGIDDSWKLQQPELVRRSPIGDEDKFTPPKVIENKKSSENDGPQLSVEPRLRKIDSVEITCLKDSSDEVNKCESLEGPSLNENDNNGSPNIHFRNLAQSVTSTPFSIVVEDVDEVESIPIKLPDADEDNSECVASSLPNFQTFFQSAEKRPHDISSNNSKDGVSSEILLEGESKSISNKDLTDNTPGYSDFENSANAKPQDTIESERSSQIEGGSQDEFQKFESSVKNRPQDLSSVTDASSLLLKSERRSSEIAMGLYTNADFDITSQSVKQSSETESPSYIVNISNLAESHALCNDQPLNVFITDLDAEEETEQPHSIIITESPLIAAKVSPNRTFDSHSKSNRNNANDSYDSHASGYQAVKNIWVNESFEPNERVNGLSGAILVDNICENEALSDVQFSSISIYSEPSARESQSESLTGREKSVQENRSVKNSDENVVLKEGTKCNGSNEVYATVNYLHETFEELLESNVDDNDFGSSDVNREEQTISCEKSTDIVTDSESIMSQVNDEGSLNEVTADVSVDKNKQNDGGDNEEDKKIALVTDNFLQNEKNFCQLDSYFPLLSDIRFTGPATEIMSTSFTQDSPTDPTSPECEQDSKKDPTAEILKEWDSDSDSHSSNSSSGEFIWKQREGVSQSQAGGGDVQGEGAASSGGESGSGSEGDEVEFVPSSWDCRAAPAKSSLRSLEQPPESKKRVVFKRQKYHCVYEYPREVADIEVDSPASYLPDYSTYSDWDPTSAEEAEMGYGQLYGGPDPLDLFSLRSGIAFGADYDEDFFISSSARPFESLGVMSTTSQFFPGMHVKPMLERQLSDDVSEDFPPPPSPLATPVHTNSNNTQTAIALTPTPSFDFTTPDSGVEDITPGSTVEEDFKDKRLPEVDACWRGDSASSSESVSPSSPREALGGLRHTRDKLKLDLPPSPHAHAPSPRHSRVFSFVLDKPKRSNSGEITDESATVPPTTTDTREDVMPEPTFSTFGKSAHCRPANSSDTDKIILTDELLQCEMTSEEVKEGNARGETKGEGTVLDSGDEDSGIESSAKTTLERNKPASDVS
ncbi:uncharacterized protein LOC116771794 isoform X2 [Danaus plexippus]|uniref:uncharacterized protein LOC116771794 isoform X2 n=1 Tax=Danaus plexippus TaxID=13037 RepID=UPI002AB3157F|nr:uncharacterized protein LOC116771794 isoform X2 [Danaus plexippus]